MGSIDALGARDALQRNARRFDESAQAIEWATRPRSTPADGGAPSTAATPDVVTASAEGRAAAQAYKANLAVLKVEDELTRETLDLLA